MAGIGTWWGATITWNSFLDAVVVGALMAVMMVVSSGKTQKHITQFFHIVLEIVTIRNPGKLFAIAKDRKPTMLLPPPGIPICIGSIIYFAYAISLGTI